MKSVTEFPTFKLLQGLKTKKELTAAGKTPEELLAAMGEAFKMEGDKLKHFTNAVDVASQNQDKLARVLVVTLADGESVPAKAVQVDEHYYVPEFQKEIKPVVNKNDLAAKAGKDGRGGKGGKGGGKPKSSPWGDVPEDKAAKKAAATAAAAAASNTEPK